MYDAMRVRSPSRLLIEFDDGGHALVTLLASRRRVRCAPRWLEVLAQARDWQALDEVHQVLAGLTSDPVGTAHRMTRIGLLLTEGSAADQADQALKQQWSWSGAAAGLYLESIEAKWLSEADEEAMIDSLGLGADDDVVVQRVDPSAPNVVALPLPRTDLPSLDAALLARRTVRAFNGGPLTLEELSTCLHYAAAVTGWVTIPGRGRLPLRTAPSGGARSPFETYVLVRDVSALAPGTYHFAAADQVLTKISAEVPDLAAVGGGQEWAADAACAVLLLANLDRVARKYNTGTSLLNIATEAGHVMQTLLVVAAALGVAPAASAALDCEAVDRAVPFRPWSQWPVYAGFLGRQDPDGDPWYVPYRDRAEILLEWENWWT